MKEIHIVCPQTFGFRGTAQQCVDLNLLGSNL